MASYEKRGNRVRASVFIDGNKHNKTFNTRKEAEIWARQQENRRDSGEVVRMPSHDTLADVIKDYVDSDGNWSHDKAHHLKRLSLDLGHITLAKLNARVIVDYITAWKAGPATRLSRVTYLGSALNHAKYEMRLNVREKDFADAKGELSTRGKVGASMARTRTTTQEEIDLIAGCAGEGSRGYQPVDLPEIMQLLAIMPIRVGELCKLKWTDIDTKARTALLRQRKHPNPRIKERNDELIPLPRLTLDGVEVDTVDLLVTKRQRYHNQDGPFPFDVGQISDGMRNARINAGVEDVEDPLRIHDLRAHAITRMLKAKVAAHTVMAVSGHKDAKVFHKHYVRQTVEDVRREWEENMLARASYEARIAELEAKLAAAKAA